MASISLLSDIESAKSTIRQYEIKYTCQFSVYSTQRGFAEIINCQNLSLDDRRVFFHNLTPYCVLGCQRRRCRYGTDQHAAAKIKRDQLIVEAQHSDHPNTVKRRKMVQSTIKKNCPAELVIKKVIMFGQCKMDADTRWKRKKAIEQAKQLPITPLPSYMVFLPDPQGHTNHPINEAAGFCLTIDGRLKNKVKELVLGGVYTLPEIRRALDAEVSAIFPNDKPARTNRSFYPQDQDISNIVQKTLRSIMYSEDDQENVSRLITTFPNENRFHFVSCNEESSDKLLLVHSTDHQLRLLGLYGCELSLLDATYKATQYALPLFFLVVKTNVDYQVCATFLVQDESATQIKSALSIIKEWCPDWKPRSFMTDFCPAESKAVRDLFPDSNSLICDFHREQDWTRFLRKTTNGIPKEDQDEIHRLLRKVAASATVDNFHQNRSELLESSVFSADGRDNLRSYINRTWLADDGVIKRWVACYRNDRFLVHVNTNNGVEALNHRFKDKYLQRRGVLSLSLLIKLLVTKVIPSEYSRYTTLNMKFSDQNRLFSQVVPAYLRNRPRPFILTCMEKLKLAETITPDMVQHISNRKYAVTGTCQPVYVVNLSVPSCECVDWLRNHLPCKHMFAVFTYTRETFLTLPDSYLSSPWLKLDSAAKTFTPGSDDTVPLPTIQHGTSCTPPSCPDSSSADVRDLLKQISGLTYQKLPTKIMEDIKGQLVEIKSLMQANLATKGGIILDSSPIARQPKSALPRRKRPAKYLRKPAATVTVSKQNSTVVNSVHTNLPLDTQTASFSEYPVPMSKPSSTDNGATFSSVATSSSVVSLPLKKIFPHLLKRSQNALNLHPAKRFRKREDSKIKPAISKDGSILNLEIDSDDEMNETLKRQEQEALDLCRKVTKWIKSDEGKNKLKMVMEERRETLIPQVMGNSQFRLGPYMWLPRSHIDLQEDIIRYLIDECGRLEGSTYVDKFSEFIIPKIITEAICKVENLDSFEDGFRRYLNAGQTQ